MTQVLILILHSSGSPSFRFGSRVWDEAPHLVKLHQSRANVAHLRAENLAASFSRCQHQRENRDSASCRVERRFC
jgi:hypothetical protein